MGLTIFGVASGIAALATSPSLLAVARGLQGVGGACAMPATLSLLGGLLVDRFWWGSVFLVNVPIAAGAIVADVVLFVVFRRQEARTDGPLVDAATAADPRLQAGVLTMTALFFTMFGCQFVVTVAGGFAVAVRRMLSPLPQPATSPRGSGSGRSV